MKKTFLLMAAVVLMAISANAQLRHSGNILLTTLGETKQDTLLSKLTQKVGDRSKEVGAVLNFEGGKLSSFTFYNVAMDGYSVYDDVWPFGLDSSKTKGFIMFAFGEPGMDTNVGDVLNYEVPGVDIELTFRGELLAKGTFTWADDYKNAGKAVAKEAIDDFLTQKSKGRVYSRKGECKEGNCKNGNGSMEMENGLKYKGDWKHYFAHGKGRIDLPKDAYYEGDFVLGYPHGQGKQKTSSGKVWEGGFKMGDRHGKGVLTTANGIKMEGSYENDKMNGEWDITRPSGRSDKALYDDGKFIRYIQ